jgi:SAM-dependent methyltransferase
MSQSISTTEKTFSSFTRAQSDHYAKARRGFHPALYSTVIDRHTTTGGKLGTVIDIGCGPGSATRQIAPYFTEAIGLDPSQSMIDTARALGGTTRSSEPIRYELSTAEGMGSNLSPPIQPSSIDLITASNAAHWFDMPQFWASAARVLKPGGSVALWCSGDIRVHQDMLNSEAIQAMMDDFFERHLKPFYEPGNLLVRDRYVDLPLPWTLEVPVVEFDEEKFMRKDYDADDTDFVHNTEANMDVFEKIMATGSPVTRWRQAHPKLEETDQDVVKLLRKEIERLLHEAGVEKGQEMIKGAVRGVLMVVKRK